MLWCVENGNLLILSKLKRRRTGAGVEPYVDVIKKKYNFIYVFTGIDKNQIFSARSN